MLNRENEVISTNTSHKNCHSLKAYPTMIFQLSIKVEMNYQSEEKEAVCIDGIKKRVPIIFNGVNPDV